MNHTKCFLSVVGHNNFYYPDDTTGLIPNNCDYTIMPWIGGKEKNLTPIKVKKSCVIAGRFGEPMGKDSIKGSTIVWVESILLPLSSVGRASDC